MPVSPLRRAPGPSPRPLIGSLPEMRKDVLGFFTELARTYGGLARFEIGPLVFHLITQPEHAQQLLVERNKRYVKVTRAYTVLRTVLGNGLVTSQGDAWLRQRRLAQPAFHRERIAAMTQTMIDGGAELCARLEERASDPKPVDIQAEMMTATLKVVTRALFSTDVGAQDSSVQDALAAALAWANAQIFSVVPVPRFIPTPANLRFRRAMATLDRVVTGIIAARRARPADQNDLLSMLMGAHDAETDSTLSDVQLRDEVLTLLVAGQETTANLLTFAWMLLAQHPEVASKVHQEIASVVGQRKLQPEDVARLTYVRQVIDETLRLYPPAWSLERGAAEDDDLAGFHIPRGSICIISPYLAHRHPDHWPNPEDFDPERFSPECAAKLHRFAYFPFGAGPRQCIGNSFALMEATILLAMVAQRLQLDLTPGHRPALDPSITLRARGMPMTLHRRVAAESGPVG